MIPTTTQKMRNNRENWIEHPRRKYTALVADVLRLHNAPRVLRADCYQESQGITALWAQARDTEYLEIDEAIAAKAKRLIPDMRVTVGDIRQIPWPDNTFDVVLDLSTIDHVPDYRRVLYEYSRVLTPGGTLLCVVWVRDGATRNFMQGGHIQYQFATEAFRCELRRYFDVFDGRLLTPDRYQYDADLQAYMGCKR